MVPNLLKKSVFVILVAFPFLITVVGVAWIIVYLGYESTLGNALPTAVYGVGALVVLAGFATWTRDRLFAGNVKLDISKTPERYLNFILAIIWAFTGTAYLMSAEKQADFVFGGISILFAFFFFLFAGGKIQIREKGIFVSTSLIKWEQINSYSFGPGSGKGVILQLRVKRWIPVFPGIVNIQVPHEKEEEVQKIIEQFVLSSEKTA